MNTLPSLWPGVVRSYDAPTRTCRVEIPGITDGSSELPIAEIKQAVGDKSEHTEIEILPGDRVWLAFLGGDPRYPIITGYRARNVDNMIDWRKWHHRNVEIAFDDVLQLVSGGARVKLDSPAGHVDVEADRSITIKAGSTITIEAGGSTITLSASGVTIRGATINLN